MKSKKQIDDAREIIRRRMTKEKIGDKQAILLMGILNALVWVADGPDCSTMERCLSGEPMRTSGGEDMAIADLVSRNAAALTALKEIASGDHDDAMCMVIANDALQKAGIE